MSKTNQNCLKIGDKTLPVTKITPIDHGLRLVVYQTGEETLEPKDFAEAWRNNTTVFVTHDGDQKKGYINYLNVEAPEDETKPIKITIDVSIA